MFFAFKNDWKEAKEKEYFVRHENYVKWNVSVHKKSCIGTEQQPFTYTLSTAAFALQLQSWVAAHNWKLPVPFREKVCQPLIWSIISHFHPLTGSEMYYYQFRGGFHVNLVTQGHNWSLPYRRAYCPHLRRASKCSGWANQESRSQNGTFKSSGLTCNVKLKSNIQDFFCTKHMRIYRSIWMLSVLKTICFAPFCFCAR